MEKKQDAGQTAITKVAKQVTALSEMSPADLSIPEKVNAIVSVAAEVAETRSAINAQDTKVKDELKRLCADVMTRECSATLYNFELGKKLTLVPKGGGVNISEEEVLASLYEHFEEEPGNTSGAAWQAWCSITNEPVMPSRTLDQDKMLAVMKNGGYLASIITSATSEVSPTYAATCKDMSKADKSAYAKGELKSNFVTK